MTEIWHRANYKVVVSGASIKAVREMRARPICEKFHKVRSLHRDERDSRLAFHGQCRFNRPMKHCATFLMIALVPLLLGMSKKPGYSITFHSQGSDMDLPKTNFPFELEGKKVLLHIVPEFSQQNIAAFYPFPSETGNGNGVTLQLDFRGKSSLEMVTRTKRGEFMLAMVNGQPVDYVAIDQAVLDGIITIWSGVPDTVIASMDKKFPRIKPGGAPSMSDKMEMLPTTKKEKKKALEDSKRKPEKESGKPVIKSLGGATDPALPSAPVSNQIPLEGGASPAPVTPAGSAPKVQR